MRRSVTKVSLSSTVVSLSDIRRERERALSPFGPLRAGLTTLQTTQDQQLSELLSTLERKIEILVSKSYEVLDISKQDTITALAERYDSTQSLDGTK